MVPVLLWLASLVLVLAGLAGTVLPALPGTPLVLAGLWLGAWIDGFARVGWLPLTLITLMAVLSWILDWVAGLLGARKAGAGRWALAGAALGTVAGLLMGFLGVLFMPLVGAALGDYLDRRDPRRALKVGTATWLGLMVGMIANVVLACMMVGVFALAWVF